MNPKPIIPGTTMSRELAVTVHYVERLMVN